MPCTGHMQESANNGVKVVWCEDEQKKNALSHLLEVGLA